MATADSADHLLLTIAEAADAARISRRHLQALLQQNEGPPVIRPRPTSRHPPGGFAGMAPIP